MKFKIASKLVAVLAGLVAGISLIPAPVYAQAAVQPSLAPTVSVMTTVAATAGAQFHKSWAWYMTRASGILAAILLALLVASGIGLLTGATYRVLEPLPAWAAHRAIGLSFGAMILVHMFVLLFDKFVGFSLADILVPFRSSYNSITIAGHRYSLYMVFGIVAMYLVALIIITSLLWMQRKPKPWRLIHYLSYAVLVLVFLHGMFMGTDLKHGWLRWVWVATGLGLLFLLKPRLRRAGTLDREE